MASFLLRCFLIISSSKLSISDKSSTPKSSAACSTQDFSFLVAVAEILPSANFEEMSTLGLIWETRSISIGSNLTSLCIFNLDACFSEFAATKRRNFLNGPDASCGEQNITDTPSLPALAVLPDLWI